MNYINNLLFPKKETSIASTCLRILGGVGAVLAVGIALLGGIRIASNMGVSSASASPTVAMISRSQLPSVQSNQPRFLIPFLPSQLSFLQNSFSDAVLRYFEGEEVCLSINSSNVGKLNQLLEFLEQDGGLTKKGLKIKKQCQDLAEGKIQSFEMNSSCQAPQSISGYVGKTKKKEPLIQKTFAYEGRLISPGEAFVGKGKDGYTLQPDLRKMHKGMNEAVDAARSEIRRNPSLRRQIALAGDQPFMLGITNPSSGQQAKVIVNLNPNKMENYQKAATFFQNQIQNIENLSEEESLKMILDTHKLIEKKLSSNAGVYRTQGVIVFENNEEDQDRTPEGLVQLVGKRGTSEDQKVLKNLLNRLKGRDFDSVANDRERQVINLLGYVPAKFQDVPQLMREFTNDLRSMIIQMKQCDDFDPIALAAYAHHKVGEIHPFEDGNGRLGRLIMNAILKEAGYQPVVFSSDAEYTQAVKENQKSPGYFAEFLRKKAIPWTETQFALDQACLPRLSC